jgi:hypothetical protein
MGTLSSPESAGSGTLSGRAAPAGVQSHSGSALAELDGLHTPNANGHIPLAGDDPTRPNEFYFRHVDAIVRMAAEKGLYIGLLPTWGDKVHARLWGSSNAQSPSFISGRRVGSAMFIAVVQGVFNPV